MKLFGLTRGEALTIVVTLLAVGAATYFNLQISFQRARDTQRKNDIRTLHTALTQYQIDFASFPQSRDGNIFACASDELNEEGLPKYRVCAWRDDTFRDIFDLSYPPYLQSLPADPLEKKGGEYLYISTGRHFQVFTALEGSDEPEYNPIIAARGLSCGNKICNYGLGDGNTPLDKTIEEYENELQEEQMRRLKEEGLLDK
ncbi:hypothetical protein A2801_02825 [Candidatus Woesebacteria bacterium RIFCSPHIGHO2_01_FULL_41_10]|uniref:Type II secretion system protein GspG C-terminal domain-containing protein n=1 Tax=Candidatus Woesebacteria bacterium RIFCSPHIGHO2_01_FULL_41_10 TaxID=1802500 RepID=A0A1F7YNV1_9BACT|nr:MAG: hypothetical protein A2801_02825 [Candidatus Woesebacteria bacterium RIFCSPHIGHO2_01_FULL_41_10]